SLNLLPCSLHLNLDSCALFPKISQTFHLSPEFPLFANSNIILYLRLKKFLHAVPTKFSKETYLYWYELMQLIRQFELKAEEMYKMAGKIRGFFDAYVDQEAIAAGCMTATKQEDPFITGYRAHGLA